MKKYSILILAAIVLIAATAVAMADNNVRVVKPFVSAGSYGTGKGQIDTPVCVKVDADDNIYILQHVHTNNVKYKSVITVYDKNLTLVRSFDVLKKSMVDVGWDKAPGGYYYDNLASAFDIDKDGNIFILCGWDVVVLDKDCKYKYQFPVSSFMGWIDNVGGMTTFYYPHGLAITDDGYVVITSGSTAQKREIIFIYPEGKLFTKMESPANDIYDIVRDRNGRLYVIEAGSNVVRSYDPTMTKETDMPLYFNGTYEGNPASLAFFSGGNFTASANGIFVYDSSGRMLTHFMDNNMSLNNSSWGRPVATNSTDWLIVVSGRSDAGKTPQPISLYKYSEGEVVGEPGEYDPCAGALGIFGFAAALYFCIRRF
jgi:hypothetical protein